MHINDADINRWQSLGTVASPSAWRRRRRRANFLFLYILTWILWDNCRLGEKKVVKQNYMILEMKLWFSWELLLVLILVCRLLLSLIHSLIHSVSQPFILFLCLFFSSWFLSATVHRERGNTLTCLDQHSNTNDDIRSSISIDVRDTSVRQRRRTRWSGQQHSFARTDRSVSMCNRHELDHRQ
jgi:hypothetical protein